MDPRPFLAEIFHSIADSAVSRSSLSWHLQLPDRLPTIQADPVRLRQILLNLLSNACKFTDMGEIVLGAEVTPPHLHVWVQDTGAGIPVEQQERIFEPFTTAEHVSRRREGIGLGLTITRQLVALHRGSMTLESQPEQGSTFHIYLPLPSLSDQPAPLPLTSAQPVLLLISAQEQPAREIVDLSHCQGLEIRRLQAGDDVEAMLRELQPTALAWDLISANANDWIIVQRLRNHPQLCHVPFILYGQNQGDKPGMTLGMTNLVTKPVNAKTLIEAISVLCPPESVGPILIVDDDPQACELYRGMVAKGLPGYPIRTARDGTTALAAMAEAPPSLVILDLMMPEMDGFEVLDWMRANQQTRQAPVLILSGRMLTLEDIKRLERHTRATFQSKDILSEAETTAILHQMLFDADTLPPHTSALVKRAVAYFQQNYNHQLSREEIARAIGVSKNYLSHIFRQELGLSPWDYLNRYRIKQAKDLLSHTSDSVTEVALQVGFNNPAYFSRMFHKQIGLSPSAYRENAK
jgi:AraC-like DNA-binding protein/DNA-binding response OmpR family regulator/anti-sigma regulatory factor (Ser/Thr protein kinase)